MIISLIACMILILKRRIDVFEFIGIFLITGMLYLWSSNSVYVFKNNGIY